MLILFVIILGTLSKFTFFIHFVDGGKNYQYKEDDFEFLAFWKKFSDDHQTLRGKLY